MSAAPSRRAVLRAAAWTAPAVTVAVAAPAFATSPVGIACQPTGTRVPGNQPQKRVYTLTPGCTPYAGTVTAVTIDGTPALPQPGGTYAAAGFGDSRRVRTVTITTTRGEWTGPVGFEAAP